MGKETYQMYNGMLVEFSPGTKHGECELCGKSFIRRSLGVDDDSTLCTKHYKQRKEAGR